MGNLLDHAKTELERIEKDSTGMQDAINRNILELVEVFESQGHSGMSANYTIKTLSALLQYKPLQPLTGEDDEWVQHTNDVFQNKRHSEVFKNGKDGEAYWISGKVFSDDGGETWFTNRDSRVSVTFPFQVPTSPERVIIK